MYCILFVVLFLFLSINAETNEETNVSILDAFLMTDQSSQGTSDAPTITRLTSNVPTPTVMPSSLFDLPGFNDVFPARCIPTENDLDIIFVIDSSTNSYSNEFNLISDIIENVLPINTRIGLINFSGCAAQYTFEQCEQQGQFKKIISLQDNYSLPNDLDVVLNVTDALQSGIHYKSTII